MLGEKRERGLLQPTCLRKTPPAHPSYLPDPYHFQSLAQDEDTNPASLSPYASGRSLFEGRGEGSSAANQATPSPRCTHDPFIICTYVSKGLKPALEPATYRNGGVPPHDPSWITHDRSPIPSKLRYDAARGGIQLRRLRWADSDRLRWLAFFCS
jgi:hypothetical protein